MAYKCFANINVFLFTDPLETLTSTNLIRNTANVKKLIVMSAVSAVG